ncbi:transcriptional regulator, TetR family [Amycolatopsis marina]|uniref:Transcriptional regulator, TetR family n=1 Tax=Amycolatopsis marina TaxID=490629 RepID=A0A1I1CMU2_9PSEU|nr:TetR/AcrR family transcriptional regulator [Amycolatopsis marina]SFB63844.1 transcriptional regulator, TetR family [Amycolatopsis marina]
MSGEEAVTAPPRGTRPRNRRALIVAAATDLFHRFGYEQVGMSDVADAVNVSSSALYRHFASKPKLLTAAVVAEMVPFRDVFARSVSVGLDELAHRMAGVATEGSRLGALWQREARSLPPGEYALLRSEIVVTVDLLAELIRVRRPELSAREAELLAQCACSALCSVSHRAGELARPQFAQLLQEITRTVLTLVPATPTPAVGPRPSGFAPIVRREQLLRAAIMLIAGRGYGSVSMEEIGAQAGISGPSVYHHFESKQQLLAVALARGEEWLRYDMYRSLEGASTAADALNRLLVSYVDFTATHSDYVDILITEARHLEGDARTRVEQGQRDYVSEWLHLMRVNHPHMHEAEARIRVRAVLTVANDMARTPHLREQPGTRDTLKLLGEAILVPGSAKAG